jgi:L-threonylcarbamoyladenylate synthase
MKSSELSSQVQGQIEKAIGILRSGGLVAFPTDTVYGLGAGAYLVPAVERLFQVKQRPREMALPLLLCDFGQINEVAKFISPAAWRLARQFLPGALTLVVYRSERVPDIISNGGDTVAIRIPAHPVPLALIKGLGMPVVGTSANVSGQPSSLSADAVRIQLGDNLDLIVDGGPAPGGKESTVVDVTGEIPVVLRQGAIPRAELETISEMA